jgi:hypothetical protein
VKIIDNVDAHIKFEANLFHLIWEKRKKFKTCHRFYKKRWIWGSSMNPFVLKGVPQLCLDPLFNNLQHHGHQPHKLTLFPVKDNNKLQFHFLALWSGQQHPFHTTNPINKSRNNYRLHLLICFDPCFNKTIKTCHNFQIDSTKGFSINYNINILKLIQ